MACPISHIIYAKKYFDKLELEGFNSLDDEKKLLVNNHKLNKDEFILGCTLPDIRRIDKNIKRSDTHLKFEPLNLDFFGLTSFQAGWKFHLYCDMRREEILNKYNFYSLENTADFYCLPAKFAEDIITYNTYNNWEKIIYYFNNINYIETDLNISKETFQLWYAIVAKYFEKIPNKKTISIFLSKQFILSDKIKEVTASMEKIIENKKALEILKKVTDEIV